MIQFSRKILVAIILIIVVRTIVFAQSNILDCDNSKRFASYLFNTRQYELAVHELERITFFCEADASTELILLTSYRKLGEFERANNYFSNIYQEQLLNLEPDFRQEYIRLLMAQKKYNQVKNVISLGLDFREKHEHILGITLLEGNFKEAYQLSKEASTQTNKMNALVRISAQSHQTPRKKPWLATIMSAVIPGSGKMYCGYWGDGIISLLFSASSGIVSYRAFNKYGTGNVYPWLAGGLALSYYTGNIYGGYNAATRYNKNLNHAFIHQTEQVLFSDY